MLQKTLFSLIFIFCIPTIVHARWRRFYVSPDFFYQQFKENPSSISEAKEQGLLIRYQLGYDSIAPFSLYYGFDIRRTKAKTKHINDLISLKTKTDNSLENYEGRIGFSIAIGPKLYITPLFALGYHQWTRKTKEVEDDKYQYAWMYKGYGLRTHLFLTSIFDLGFFIQFMQPYKIDLKVEKNGELSHYAIYLDYLKGKWPTLKLKTKLQYEIEIPLYFHAPSFRLLDITIVPYFRSLNLGHSNKKNSTSDIFLYQGSNTYDIGVRLEIGINL